MNYQDSDLHELNRIWNASSKNLRLRKIVEIEIKNRISKNNKFSREYLFERNNLQNHALTISFIPTTSSFDRYGATITVDLVLSEAEQQQILNNYYATPPKDTYGQLKAKNLLQGKLSGEQNEDLENIGFNTNEILSIQKK